MRIAQPVSLHTAWYTELCVKGLRHHMARHYFERSSQSLQCSSLTPVERLDKISLASAAYRLIKPFLEDLTARLTDSQRQALCYFRKCIDINKQLVMFCKHQVTTIGKHFGRTAHWLKIRNSFSSTLVFGSDCIPLLVCSTAGKAFHAIPPRNGLTRSEFFLYLLLKFLIAFSKRASMQEQNKKECMASSTELNFGEQAVLKRLLIAKGTKIFTNRGARRYLFFISSAIRTVGSLFYYKTKKAKPPFSFLQCSQQQIDPLRGRQLTGAAAASHENTTPIKSTVRTTWSQYVGASCHPKDISGHISHDGNEDGPGIPVTSASYADIKVYDCLSFLLRIIALTKVSLSWIFPKIDLDIQRPKPAENQ